MIVIAIVAAGNEIIIAFIALIGVLAGAIGVPYTVRKAKSGKIDTTEATDLWRESTSMRTELRTEVANLNAEIKLLRDENRELKAENSDQRARVEKLETQLVEVQASEALMRDRIQELERAHG